MTLCVRFPNDVKVFDVHSLHRMSVKQTEAVEDAGLYTWKIDRPVLPHQGIVFWWRCNTGQEESGNEDEKPVALGGEIGNSDLPARAALSQP